MSSPQSPPDFLPAVRDKSQQLEEELTNHREVPAGGTTKRQHQLGPEQGTHDTNIRDTNQNHNPSPSCLISTGFSFLFSVIQVQYFFILFDPVLISPAEDGRPDREANHLGESPGSQGDH